MKSLVRLNPSLMSLSCISFSAAFHAYDNNMVFLSTGIGSQPDIGFSETQGSTLSQKIYNKIIKLLNSPIILYLKNQWNI